MKYISCGTWRDLTDHHLYHEGDLFPFDGREIQKDRLDSLLNGTNRAGLVLIRAEEDEVKAAKPAPEPEKAPEKAPEAKPAKKPAAKKPAAKKPVKK